jgi:HrpA-like RNA helicase
MGSMGVHPRFAHLVLRASALKATEVGAVLAALLSEKDLMSKGGGGERPKVDINSRLRILGEGGQLLF